MVKRSRSTEGSSADEDERWMRRCLELARRAEGRTAPNPIVGCVIVKGGKVLAEGWHERAGEPHAEAVALARLRGKAAGATLYVNLEPCNHQGRTPPCAPAVLASGVRRVVIGAMDPDPEHTGGARRLARGGVEVVRGVLADECLAANRPWLSLVERGRPHIVLKAATSLDGRIATRTGDSHWITGEAARAEGHQLRDRLDAVLVGVNTVLVDDPRLTVRLQGGRDPMRIVLDTSLRTPPTAKVLRRGVRVVVATTKAAPAAKIARLEQTGAEVWVLPASRGKVDLFALLRRLGKDGVMGLLVEGGAEVHASFLRERLADEVRLYIAPLVIGGGRGDTAGPSWTAGLGVARLGSAHRLVFDGEPRRIGDDIVLVARRPPT